MNSISFPSSIILAYILFFFWPKLMENNSSHHVHLCLETKLNTEELVTVIGSDLFDLDDYIKSYLLEHSDMSFATAVKIILRYSVTDDVILQLNIFKNYLETVNFCLFQEVFGKTKTRIYK